jgi:capsular polysaccharide transport system permease protein
MASPQDSPTDSPRPETAGRKKSIWHRGPWRKLLFLVGMPVLVATLYFGLMASDMYVSESTIAVKVQGASQVSTLDAFVSAAVGGVQSGESGLVLEYIRSRRLLQHLQDTLDFEKWYSSEDIDPVSRLPRNSTKEERLDYYRDKVTFQSRPETGVIVLRVRAFQADQAQMIAQEIIRQTEAFVNHLSERMQQDLIYFAESIVREAEGNVLETSDALQRFSTRYHNIDPMQTTGGILSLIQELQSRLIQARIELAQHREYMRENSPKIQEIQASITAIEHQIALHKELLTGESQQSLADILQEYEQVKLNHQMAMEQYKMALVSLDAARKEAGRKSKYLLCIEKPGLPDEATEPDRLLKIATVFAVCLMAYAVGGLLIAAIREHQM